MDEYASPKLLNHREGLLIITEGSGEEDKIGIYHNFKLVSFFGCPFIKLFFVYVVIFNNINIINCLSYSDFTDEIFLDPIFAFENGWTIDVDEKGNSFLQSNPISCGQETSFSVAVNYDVRKNINFRWKKIGTNSKLTCYYNNAIDSQHCITYEGHNWLSSRITIPPGDHIITWKLSVDSCNGNGFPSSVASIDDIQIPESSPKISCSISTIENAVIGQELNASVPFIGSDATYNWRTSSGGIIKSKKPYTNTIIWKAKEAGTTEIYVEISNRNGTCSDSKKCNISEREIIDAYDYMDLNDLINRSENKVLLLNDGNYTDEIIIRAKNIKIIPKNISGVTFDPRGSDYCIVIDNTSDVFIEGLNIIDCSGGFIIYNSKDCTISNNTIESNTKPAIFLDLSSFNVIKNNIIKPSIGCEGQAIRLNNSKSNNISNNSILVNGYAFLLDSFSVNNTFSHDEDSYKPTV